MEFKVLVLCFAFFVATASGASLCKCTEEEKKDTVSKYTVKINDGNKELDETVEIDTEKETETFHIADNGDTSPTSPGEVDIVYDFKKNLALYRMSNKKACYLRNSTDNLLKPEDLKKQLEMKDSQGPFQKKPKDIDYVVGETVDDRSILSDEMAALCAKLPIYRIQLKSVVEMVEKQSESQLSRKKRQVTVTPTPKQCRYYLIIITTATYRYYFLVKVC